LEEDHGAVGQREVEEHRAVVGHEDVGDVQQLGDVMSERVVPWILWTLHGQGGDVGVVLAPHDLEPWLALGEPRPEGLVDQLLVPGGDARRGIQDRASAFAQSEVRQCVVVAQGIARTQEPVIAWAAEPQQLGVARKASTTCALK